MSLSAGETLPEGRITLTAFVNTQHWRQCTGLAASDIPASSYVAPYPPLDQDCFAIRKGDIVWGFASDAPKGGFPQGFACFNGIAVMKTRLADRPEATDFGKYYGWLVKNLRFLGVAVADYPFDPMNLTGGPSGGITLARAGTIQVVNVGPAAIAPGALVIARPPRTPGLMARALPGFPRNRAMTEVAEWDPSELFMSAESVRRYHRLDTPERVNKAWDLRPQDDLERRKFPNYTAESTATLIRTCAWMGARVLAAYFRCGGANAVLAQAIEGAPLAKIFGVDPLTVEDRATAQYRISEQVCANHLNQPAWKDVGTDTALLALCMGTTNGALVGAPSIAGRNAQQNALTDFLAAWHGEINDQLSRVIGSAHGYAAPGEPLQLLLRSAMP